MTKTIASEELVDAVRRVAEGDAVFSPRLAGFVLDAFSRPDATVPATPPQAEEPEDGGVNPDVLTRREREVLRLLARGYTPRNAAVVGVFLHGAAGDKAAEYFGREAMNSSDLIDFLAEAWKDAE